MIYIYIIQYICLAYTVHMHVSAMIRWDAILKKEARSSVSGNGHR